MLKKSIEKPRSKISCHHTWMLHAKNCPSWWRFLRSFLTASKPSRRSITAGKRREKAKKERRKKISKNWKALRRRSLSPPKTQNFDFCTCPTHNALKRDAGGKKGKLLCCKCIFDWFKGNLAEIQPKNDQNVQKCTFCKKFQESMGWPQIHVFSLYRENLNLNSILASLL